MSAFLVTNETINKCCVALQRDASQACEDLDKLGSEMLLHNHRALHVRYGDKVPGDVQFKFRPRNYYTPHALFKALSCWLYQCGESNELIDHELWQNAKTKRDQIAVEIVHKLPECAAQPWE